ncbi:MAG: hypothetical protein WBV60_05635, partial [Terriglobales bacterium]
SFPFGSAQGQDDSADFKDDSACITSLGMTLGRALAGFARLDRRGRLSLRERGKLMTLGARTRRSA